MRHDLAGTIRDLHRRRGRERRGRTLAEGIRLVEEALASGVAIDGAVVAPALDATPRGRALRDALAARGLPVEVIPDREFGALASTEQPQGVLAVVALPQWEAEAVCPLPGHPVLLLDGVQDPGNVGSIARTALALGAAGLVALPGTAELANPKVVRSAMGALFRLPAAHLEAATLPGWLRAVGAALWVAETGGDPVASVPSPEMAYVKLMPNIEQPRTVRTPGVLCKARTSGYVIWSSTRSGLRPIHSV